MHISDPRHTNVNPSLLLIEPDTLGYSERAAQLGKAHFCVTRADGAREVYLMRDTFPFSIAVLSDVVGSPALRAAAQIVRKQWPAARILILGKASSELDDHLYDEAVGQTSSETALLAMVGKVLEDPWNQRGGNVFMWMDRATAVPRLQQSRVVWESDPTKVAGRGRQADFARDRPAIDQMRLAGR